MKFKLLCVLLNIVLFSAFLIVFFLPLFLVSPEYFIRFWQRNWGLALFFLVSVGILNMIFFKNWRILSYLEHEDWPALAQHLEQQVFYRKKTGKRTVRLLFESLVLLGDFDAVQKLSDTLQKENPSRYRETIRGFVGAAILNKNYRHARVCVTEALKEGDLDCITVDWLTFYRGLSRYLDSDKASSAYDLAPLARSSCDPLVTALSGYLCCSLLTVKTSVILPISRETLQADSQTARDRILSKFTSKKWYRYLDDACRDLEMIILGKLPDMASEWLFPN